MRTEDALTTTNIGGDICLAGKGSRLRRYDEYDVVLRPARHAKEAPRDLDIDAPSARRTLCPRGSGAHPVRLIGQTNQSHAAFCKLIVAIFGCAKESGASVKRAAQAASGPILMRSDIKKLLD